MRPLALLVILALAAPARALDPAGDPEPAPERGPAPAAAAPSEGRALGDNGKLGLAFLGGGAAVAASTAAATALLEAVSRNDSDPDAAPANPELVQVSGFAIVTLLSVSAGVMLLGGALVAEDLSN